jgi:3-oxoacyl-[acyl-carrier-protein] synthase II
MTQRRVAVTGLGIVSPHGADPSAAFAALMRGESAVERVTLESGGMSFTTAAARVRGEPWQKLPRAQRVLTDRVSQYALLAAGDAVRDAGLRLENEDRSRIGASVGTCMGGIISTEQAYSDLFRGTSGRVAPFTLVKTMYNAPAAQIALQHQLTGPSLTYTTTCSSSTVSVGEAMRTIRHGYADVMIAGGAEALLVFGSVKAWLALQIVAAEDPDDAAATCRPFSLGRKGTVLGEGAAFVILEELGRARARGARIRAELAGYGVTNDSAHMTQPSIEGQARTMRAALADAGVPASTIDYINAHGTGTPLNDIAETNAVKAVFGDDARRLAISSTKSMHGHLVGAAGALELVITVLALENQQAPPTAHLAVADPECDLDYVPNRGRPQRIRAAMSNSFAFGGVAGALVVLPPPVQ